MKFAIYLLLLLHLITADTYWVFPFLLSSVFLVYPVFIIGFREHTRNYSKYKTLIVPFLIFFLYIYIIQIFRQEDPIVSTYLFVSINVTIFVSLYFRERPQYIVWYYIAFTIINLSFQFLQMAGVHATAETILKPFGYKTVYDEVSLFDRTRGFRFSGLFVNVVPLGLLSGAITAYFWILYNQSHKYKHLAITLCALLMSVLTNTRAVIYSIVPTMILVDYIVWRKLSAKFITLCIAFACALIIMQANTGYTSSKSSSMNYSAWEKDGGVVDRIQGNVYGTVGTLNMNPFFGVSEKQQGEAILKGHKIVGMFFGDRFINHTTYHNLPLFYLRVYGLIGFFLFLYAYWNAMRFAYRLENPTDRQYMLTILIYFFLYNMSHNMKVDYLYFWLTICATYQSFQHYLNYTNNEEKNFNY